MGQQRSTTLATWEFALELDRRRGTSLSRQIALALSADIQRGRLRPGERLPGSRTLATTLRVHRQTVVAALDDLVAEGWLVSKEASGTFVAGGLPDAPFDRRRHAEPSRRAVSSKFALELPAAPAPELPRTGAARALLMSGAVPMSGWYPQT